MNLTELKEHVLETLLSTFCKLEELNMSEETITEILQQRGNRYGDFCEHAAITQRLKQTMRNTPNWEKLSPAAKESLEMIQHKIGRILNGDPNYKDSWTDVIGYAKLVEKELTND
jgi:hypothetical protein